LLEVPSLPNVETQTDWAEMSLLFSQKSSISRSDYVTALEESGHSDPEPIIGNIWHEAQWRQASLPEYYPVDVRQSRLVKKRNWESSLSYSFMLLISRHTFYKSTKITNKTRRVPLKLFERLVSVSLKEYLGRSLNIGFPREGVFKKKSFRQGLQYISDIIYEELSDPLVLKKKAKDEGLDVIAWKPIDKRPGQTIILTQCTIGDDWKTKTGEISIENWQDIINFAAKPMRALAFPIVYHDQWNYWSKKGGILFDRLRLTLLFPKDTSYLQRAIKTWTETQMIGLKVFD